MSAKQIGWWLQKVDIVCQKCFMVTNLSSLSSLDKWSEAAATPAISLCQQFCIQTTGIHKDISQQETVLINLSQQNLHVGMLPFT